MKRLVLAALLLLAAPAAADPLTIAKSSALVSDPINLIVLPKRIPGALVDYNLRIANPNAALDLTPTFFRLVSVADPIPVGTALFVGDLGLPGSGPVVFSDGSVLGLLGTGLTYNYVSLASTADSLEFSRNNGASYDYTPVADADGVDALVTNIRVRPSGTQAPGSGFNLRFRVRVR